MLKFPVLVDAAKMALAPVPANPGAHCQTLLSGDDTVGPVQIVYGPPGFTQPIRDLLARGPHRHYHRTVRERHYVLGGDFPIWHWNGPAALGNLTRLRRHHYLENPPVTLHGITPEATPEAGWKILQWTDGYGTDLTEPQAATETFEVGFDDDATNLPFDKPVLVHADELPWMQHPTQSSWQIKQLAGGTTFLSPVSLVNIPARWNGRLNDLASRREEASWCFVVSGDLTLELHHPHGGRSVTLREDGFLAWKDESAPAAGRTEGGCVVLCAGHQMDGN